MDLKRSILTLLVSATLTPLLGQCDSAISVCPAVFDRLIAQDLRERQCSTEINTVKAEMTNLKFQLQETESVLQSTSDILLITNKEKGLLSQEIDLKDKQLKKKTRQITWLKLGIVAVSCVGVTTTVYAFFH